MKPDNRKKKLTPTYPRATVRATIPSWPVCDGILGTVWNNITYSAAKNRTEESGRILGFTQAVVVMGLCEPCYLPLTRLSIPQMPHVHGFILQSSPRHAGLDCHGRNKQRAHAILRSDMYKRVLLKISGEALAAGRGFGIDAVFIHKIAAEIAAVHALGCEIAIVVGGGNFFRR